MITSKEDYEEYLRADISSSYNFKEIDTVLGTVKVWLGIYEEIRFIKAMRYLEYCENVLKKNSLLGVLIWLYAKLRFKRLSIRLGYSIPINVCGPGLSLPHRGNIIINPNSKIGANCRIHVGVNIGGHHDKAPIIGDNVYIGPGAILFGNIRIANNVTIGANATVTKSFLSENVAIAGTPAKIIKENYKCWCDKSSDEK